jgi:transketolase
MPKVQSTQVETYKQLAQQLRVDSIRSTTEAGSGHPTSAMSAADLMAVLITSFLKYDFDRPELGNNDRLIFSKGHACPLLYSIYKAAGAITDKELLSLRKFGSRLEGHPVPKVLPWVDVATGSLGQGLACGVGMAIAGKLLDKHPFHVWVLLGDSEMAEGSVWEALACASHYRLDNLVAILDMNRLGQRGETMLGWNSRVYAERARAFGWHAIEIDGHDYAAIERAYSEARSHSNEPTFIVAKTEKGHGVSLTANKDGWHGKALSKEQAQEAIAQLGGVTDIVVKVAKPEAVASQSKPSAKGEFICPDYQGTYSTREAYGDALKVLGGIYADLVVLDAEVGNSTYSEKFDKAYSDRYFEIYIAEQCMAGVAEGLSTRGKIAFAATFAAFWTRAYDFIRMAAISRANLRLSGSHSGVSIGQDGPSQMALEDLAMMRAVFSSTVLYPSDAVCAAHLVNAMVDLPGISYLRTTREKTNVLYKKDEKFPIGGSKVLRNSDKDKVTVIAAGITLHESLKAYDELQKQGIAIRVIDAYSVKPIDRKTIEQAARQTRALIVVEDHWPEGGLGEAVLDVFVTSLTLDGGKDGGSLTPPKVVKLAVSGMPGSGTPEELLDAAGISAKHIVAAVKAI